MDKVKAAALLRYFAVMAAVLLLTCTGCASSKKYHFDIMDAKSSCDMAHMGKNKYFFSGHYQKKLKKNLKKVGSRK